MSRICVMTSQIISVGLAVLVATGLLLTSTAGTIAVAGSTADQLMQQGLQAYQRGAFDQALTAWKQAASLYEKEGKVMDQSRALVQAAQASESMGQVNQALRQLDVALALAQNTRDQAWIATVLNSLGHAYLAARQPDAAVEHLNQALETAPKDSPIVGAVQNNLGLAQVAQKHWPEALASFDEAANRAAAAGDRPLTVRTNINAGRTA